tara:strand:- start:32 stop:1210 length:1179 start_codon:yes stop_codon:yes gene_type:complete
MSYNSLYQSLTGNTSPTVGDYLYYYNGSSNVATEWVILDIYSNNDIRYKKNQSGWSTSQQKERGIGWTGSGWTEDPWTLSADKEPDLLSNDGTFASATATCSDATTISTWTTGGASYAEGSFLSPFFTSGPTVTSITATKVIVPSDTISNTDFTLLKNGSAYANSNISVSLGTFDPADTPRFYDYTLQINGSAWYNTTIDSKTYDNFYYDDTWTSSASSYIGRSNNVNIILNVLGTIPNNTIMTWTGSTTLTKDGPASSDKEIRWYSSNGGASGTDRNSNYGLYVTGQGLNIVAIFYHYSQGFGSNITYSSPFTVGAQATMSYTAAGNTVYVQDWVYSAEPEGDGYEDPVSTTSNGGGKPDRYPIIMTNLFNRNRSLYSIGMTHKDTWDLFL